jgi:predicted dehydrogenase
MSDRARSAADAVGVALVGFGYWGANLARNIRAVRGLRLVGIADPDRAQREAAVETFEDITTWPSLDDALADDAVEAVVIASPAGFHGELARRALEAGRHVMVEKPLATEPDEAELIVKLAGEHDLIAMVGHTFLYSPPVQRLKTYIDDGALGDVQYLYSQRLSLGRIRRDCNALWNFAPHDVAIMLHLLDERPTAVSATSMTMIDPQVPDVFFARLEFPSGIGAHLHVSWIDPRKTRLMTIVGDRQMAIYNDVSVDQKVWLVDAGVAVEDGFGEYQSMGDFQWRTRAGDIVIPKIDGAEPLRNEMAAFAEACATGTPPLSDARHGADVVAILAAIDESARRRGTPVGLEW